jgi:putative membrane protein insertion efficiency factor
MPGATDVSPVAERSGGNGAVSEPEVRRGAVARRLISVIHAYQLLRVGRPTGCRFLPTCSEYAIDAIDRHGVARGSGLAVKRLMRCNPWGGHGIDPVPERRAS